MQKYMVEEKELKEKQRKLNKELILLRRGTVVATSHGWTDKIKYWKEITSIACGAYHTIGLKKL